MRRSEFWRPFVASLVLTPLLLFVGLASGGAGHGDYVLARLLFPYALLAAVTSDSLGPALMFVLGVAQWPLYGLALGAAACFSPLVGETYG